MEGKFIRFCKNNEEVKNFNFPSRFEGGGGTEKTLFKSHIVLTEPPPPPPSGPRPLKVTETQYPFLLSVLSGRVLFLLYVKNCTVKLC